MENFIFHNPVKIIFGKDTIKEIGKEAAAHGKKALLVYGGGSIKKNGIYEKVVASLKENDLEFIEHSGVVPNPVLSHARAGIALAKAESIDMIIAVGGGSSIDESKIIAAGAKVDHDVWDFVIGKEKPVQALPLLVVLTLAATASEMNNGGVITNEETKEKFALMNEVLFPKVSILDPEATFTVPPNHTAYGAVDAISHIMEGYFNHTATFTVVQDNIMEGLIRSIMRCQEMLLLNPQDYNGRAGAMWSATLALNGLAPSGIGPAGFPVHMIEHSLSALYDIPHGAGLAIVIPAWLRYNKADKAKRIARMARNCFTIEEPDYHKAAEKGIDYLEGWFKKIGAPTSLEEVNIPDKDIPDIAENAHKLAQLWQMKDYSPEKIAAILKLAAKGENVAG
jgi:alcohol dehydrogenase YqhD (iron-dependent ADH family)